MKRRIILFTDSLALPRMEPQQTLFEDTYPYLLRESYEVFQFSKGGGLIHELVEQAHYYKQYKPDVVILHAGIVDCGCRAFSHKEELFFQSNIIGRIIRKLISMTITTKRLRNIRRKTWTTQSLFTTNCEKLKNTFDGIPVYAMSILTVSDDYEKKVPGMREHVKAYNQLLKNVFGENLIDLSDIPIDGIMTDGHHLTKKGHDFVYAKLIQKLNS